MTRRQLRKLMGSRVQRRANTKLRGALMERDKNKHPDPRTLRRSPRDRLAQLVAEERP